MGSATTSGLAPVAWFSEAQAGTTTLRLAAAVAWRGVPTASALLGGGGPLGWLRALRHRLWLRLGLLGADVSFAGLALFGGAAHAAHRVSSVGLAPEGESLAYFDHGGRTLRVLGRTVAAPPPGKTLVALVDATGPHASAPQLVLRVVHTPTITVQAVAPPTTGAAVSHSYVVGMHASWTEALRADPIVLAFLDGTGER